MIALTHVPSPNMQACERTYVPHAAIDYSLVVRQHEDYRAALTECGAEVITLDVNRGFPDATFIEDTAIVLDEIVILCTMGTASRRDEPVAIEPILKRFRHVERVESVTGCSIEGGDVLRIGRKLLVGLSSRTTATGIQGLAWHAVPLGYEIVIVPVRNCLHLKTACTALPDGRLLVNRSWIDVSALAGLDLVHIPEAEPWGANIAVVGENVILAADHLQTAERIRELGFNVIPIDLSEFAKAEGGVTCLSLLIP